MNVVRVKGLHKYYGDLHAVKGVDLEVEEGSIHAILGPNGAGKTTTIKCLLGILKPQKGEVEVLGSSDPEKVLSSISYVPEEKEFYEFLTPVKAVRFCERFVEKFDPSKAIELIKEFRLPENARIGTFSHGMKTQLYLSLALAQNASLFVFDEPTWGLDPIVRNVVLDMIRELSGERTVLYTSHILPEVEKIADKVSIMVRGRFVFHGELEEAKRNFKYIVFDTEVDLPRNLVVATIKKTGAFIAVVYGEDNLQKVKELYPGKARVEEMNLEDIFMSLVRGDSNDDE
ncbi:MAG: type transport system ATP-binding protein [Thermotogota bacterium]|nr:type transport system ATP-binding protein [Thermotogota bacterium]MDK2865676.1 type transport system ATP-binding protein [Thermotogota bacterium]HCZ06421.1 ABC transporter ATP-binding protein [Thermotogota bacterium]